jgi:hypothetical protein
MTGGWTGIAAGSAVGRNWSSSTIRRRALTLASPPYWAINSPGANRISNTKSRFRTLQNRPNLKYKPNISNDDR